MPTGYTAAVQDGKITELAPFALHCARAFGAFVLMRDAPIGAPIPEAFEPNRFYLNCQRDAEQRLVELRRFSPLDAQRACQQEHTAATARWRDRRAERALHRARYQAMLDQVEAWSSPSDDHDKFKLFMLNQLSESMRFDCDADGDKPPRLARWPDWLARNIARTTDNIARHGREYDKELARTADRNRWLIGLRESLVFQCVNYIQEAA